MADRTITESELLEGARALYDIEPAKYGREHLAWSEISAVAQKLFAARTRAVFEAAGVTIVADSGNAEHAESMRGLVAYGAVSLRCATKEAALGKFDAWLAEERRAAAEKAWDELDHWFAAHGATWDGRLPANPYRAQEMKA